MRERSSNVNRVGKPLRLLAVLVALVGGSGCVGSESETEELGVTQEAASIRAWDFFGDAMSFDIGDGIACNFVPYPNVNTMQ